jgi:hypothetical protein
MNGSFVYTAPGVTQPGIASGKLLSVQPVAVPVALAA